MQFDIYKPYGLSPKDVLDAYRTEHPHVKKMAFACRLDPMACGKLPIFTDEACVLADGYSGLDKRYRFKMIVGIHTTSLDLLGFIDVRKNVMVDPKEITRHMNDICKHYVQTLPNYSSFAVGNDSGEKHPLWWWSKNKRLHEIKIPSFEKILYEYKIVGEEHTTLSEVAKLAIARIGMINPKHDFKQTEIVAQWESLIKDQTLVQILEFDVIVSSGFYIRKLVEDLGEKLHVPTATLEIERIDYFVYGKQK